MSTTTYLPVQVSYHVRIAADEQRIQIRPKSSAGALQHYQLRDLEDTPDLARTTTASEAVRKPIPRPSLSRRFSQSIRWSWRPKPGNVEEEESIVNEHQSTETVKRVIKWRDWSCELDEDDVQGRENAICKESCITWAESAADIGRYWRFITSDD